MEAVLQTKTGGLGGTAFHVFMGNTSTWYKQLVLAVLVLNPIALLFTSKFVVGWLMVAEFIGFLAGALKCYPLLPGGLLAIEAVVMGMTTPDAVYNESHHNFEVILLLMFVVAGVHFLRDWLTVVFRAIMLKVKSKILLALCFTSAGVVLSANLDALTVVAVMMVYMVAMYDLYNAYRSQQGHGYDPDDVELTQLRTFMCTLAMHLAVGSMLGGVMTPPGEPHNLLIAAIMRATLPPELAEHWQYMGFVKHMSVVTFPTLIIGMATTILLEGFAVIGARFGYGALMPRNVRNMLEIEAAEQKALATPEIKFKLWVQGVAALLLVAGLATHIAAVGLLGLGLIIALTVFTGVNEEHHIGEAFTAALPFCALLVTFFVIVAMIQDQGLFDPIVMWALGFEQKGQQVAFYSASGGLSAISDNVFVATIFINAAKKAYESGLIDAVQFEKLAIAINTGTNIPSIATPNGQAAFLFLLTSPLAAKIGLGYGKMLKMALPYTIVCTAVSLTALWLWL